MENIYSKVLIQSICNLGNLFDGFRIGCKDLKKKKTIIRIESGQKRRISLLSLIFRNFFLCASVHSLKAKKKVETSYIDEDDFGKSYY